jgi:hypothetical protein
MSRTTQVPRGHPDQRPGGEPRVPGVEVRSSLDDRRSARRIRRAGIFRTIRCRSPEVRWSSRESHVPARSATVFLIRSGMTLQRAPSALPERARLLSRRPLTTIVKIKEFQLEILGPGVPGPPPWWLRGSFFYFRFGFSDSQPEKSPQIERRKNSGGDFSLADRG